jgi:hypothetical protein
MSLQNSIFQGETLNYSATLNGYSASEGWSLRLVLNPRAGGAVITLNTSADGDNHVLQVTAAVTATWAVGDYGYQLYAIKGAEVYFQREGQFKVRAGLIGSSGGIDTRSLAQKALDDANAALAAWSPTTRRYKINGREMEFNSPAEIITIISHWTVAVQREQAGAAIAAGRPNPRKMQVRLGRA